MTIYRALRQIWSVPAKEALSMSRTANKLFDAGYQWGLRPETESAEAVFGPACPVKNCRNPHCTFIHYQPTAPMNIITWYAPDGSIAASLGMVEDDGRTGWYSYNWLCAMELATEVVVIDDSKENG